MSRNFNAVSGHKKSAAADGGSSVAAPFHLKRRFQHPLYADVNGNLVLLDGFAAFG